MRKILLCVAFVVALVAGGLTLAGADTVHYYLYNSGGIMHNAGWGPFTTDLEYNGVTLPARNVWVVDGTGGIGPSDWYGPKNTPTFSSSVEICWYYTSPSLAYAEFVFDVTTGPTPTVLWSTTKHIPAVTWTTPYHLTRYCHTIVNMIGTFSKFQIRARATSIGPGDLFYTSVLLYKVSYQALDGL